MIYIKQTKINTAQAAAAEHLDGPMMVLAGPGSGKTTVIIKRIINLIEKYGINPRSICVITFTKAAANEMKTRFLSQFNAPDSKQVFISTFHALFFMILQKHGLYNMDSILKEDERIGIIRSIAVKHGAPLDDETSRIITSEISFIKNDMIPAADYHSLEISDELFLAVYNAYEDFKKRHNKIDFDDMMCKCYELFEQEPRALDAWRARFRYILIDEFQDINKIQYELTRKLAAPANNLFIVGDDDQSIYRFRGARPDFLLDFKNEYKNTAEAILDTNYRSTDNIIALSNEIIKGNTIRYGKEMTGTGRKGTPPMVIRTFNTETEAAAIAERIIRLSKETSLSEMAVVYRINLQSRAFIDAFINRNIPFAIKDEAPSIYEHWIMRDIAAYMTLSQDLSANAEAERIINKPARYINSAYIKEAKHACAGSDKTLINLLFQNRKLKEYQRARITELCFYLSGLKNRKPYDAYRYIRQAVNYDDYIREYCSYRKIRPTGLFEILDELTEGSKPFETIVEYLAHIENARETAKQKPRITQRTEDSVTLSTLHGVKGLEFDIVFIAGAVEGLLPHEKCVSPEAIEEERRLFYVGATRARNRLYISVIENRNENAVSPTEFLPILAKQD